MAVRACFEQQGIHVFVHVRAAGKTPYRHTSGKARLHAIDAVFDHQAARRRHTQLFCHKKEEIGRGLGMSDMLGGIDMRRERVP